MLFRYNALSCWEDKRVRERLSWYYEVMLNRKPAKFKICRFVESTVNPSEVNFDKLLEEHKVLQQKFINLLGKIRSGTTSLEEMEEPKSSLLDVKIELAKRMLKKCSFCEWRCRVDRTIEGKRGACKLGEKTFVSTWFHHYGEEPPLVGSGGSGTIFFTSCTFRCVFCQNWDISQDWSNGVEVDARRLALIIKRLRVEGALNINFVGGDPTMHLHTILESMRYVDVNVPMLWNSNMYLTEDAMNILKDVIDIWLPDFKYGNDRCALRLSKVPRYFETVARNHRIAHSNGDVIIRHLVLPNHIECCTKPVLAWIAENCPRALVNVMGQYHPDHLVPSNPDRYSEVARRLRREELEKAYAIADSLGLVYEPVS
ncbi:MAG: radical SAM protein [Nitrososphaerales archaeon]